MIKVFNRVKQTSNTPGSGDVSFVQTPPSYQAFSGVLSSGDKTYYTIVNRSDWEVGIGTYLSNSISRDLILSSSTGQKINLTGPSDVFIAYPAEKSVYKDENNIAIVDSGIQFYDSSVQTTAFTPEVVQDIVSSLLTAGTGIQLSYNDSGNSLAIDAYGILPTGGTAGQILSKIDGVNYNTTWIDNYATEVVQYVKNSSHTTLNKGQVVYINGADGTNPTIALAVASGESGSSKTLGFLKQTLAQGEFGYVVTEGELGGLNTNAANTDGDTVWLSPTTPGDVVYGLANKPSAPNHMVFLGYVVRKNANNGRIFVKVQNGFELEELHNVVAKNPNDGDIIRYNSASGLWQTQALPAGYSDEQAQDAVGGILANTSTINLSYNDNTPSISATIPNGAITNGLLSSGIDVIKLSGVIPSGNLAGNNISLFVNDAGYLTSHPIINSAPSSDNSGRTYIQDLLLDSNGHVTGIATATETVTDTTYTAGTGLVLSGTEFNLQNTAVSSGVYGSANQVGSFTVDPQGRITSASNITITPSGIGAIGSLNGLIDSTQVFATGTTGTDFNIVSSGTTHTFNLPDASATARGVVTTSDQTISGNKTFTNPIELTPTWNNSGVDLTCIKANATDIVSGSGTTLIDLQVNNISKFSVNKSGVITADGVVVPKITSGTNEPTGGADGDIYFQYQDAVGLTNYVPEARTITINNVSYDLSANRSWTISAVGIASLNGLTVSPQTIVTGTSGTDFNIVSQGSVHALNIPDAGAAARGFITTGAQTIAGNKTFSGNVAALQLIIGGSSDLFLVRDAANTLAQVNSTSAQVYRIYNTFTNSTNYERLALQFGTFSSVRHSQIAAESAGTGTANINLVLSPRGTGAFILGPPPDGTTTGGNARGQYAVDLQMQRGSASQVASATGSFLFPAYRCVASGQYSIVGGYQNTAAGYVSVVFSGANTSESGYYNFVAAGNSTVNAVQSAVFGHTHSVTGRTCLVTGCQTSVTTFNSIVTGNNSFSTNGDSQVTVCIPVSATSSDGVSTKMLMRESWAPSTSTFTIPANKTFLLTLEVVARSDTGERAFWEIRGLVSRAATAASSQIEDLTTLDTFASTNASGWTVVVTANTTNSELEMTVTGASGQTVRFVGAMKLVEVGY